MNHYKSGFSLIELMIVIAIIAFLSLLSVPSLLRFLSKAKRTEAQVNLGSLYTAQRAHWAEHSTYETRLSGPQAIGWKPEGYRGGGKQERFNYTYGFSQGSEGINFFTGKLETPSSALGTTKADKNGFTVGAVAELSTGKYDLLTINELHDLVVVKDGIE